MFHSLEEENIDHLISLERSHGSIYPMCGFKKFNPLTPCQQGAGRLRDLVVACSTTDHNHPFRISAWAYLKVVSSLTSLHSLWKSLGPFSLPYAQKWS